MSNPLLIVKNQFGEQSNLAVLGGSAALDINFVVDSANGNGLGVRSVKVVGAAQGQPTPTVYMHTSATPAVGSPNPAAGLIQVAFPSNSFTAYVGGYAGMASPVSGTPILVTTGVVAGGAYIIASLGNTPAAGWHTLGVPASITPAVGVSFVAPATVVTTGTGVIEAAGVSGIDHVELIGDPNLSLATGQVLLQCLASGVLAAPADGTVIGLRFVFAATFSEV